MVSVKKVMSIVFPCGPEEVVADYSMIIRIEVQRALFMPAAKFPGLQPRGNNSQLSTSNTTDNDARLVVVTTNTALIDMDMISLSGENVQGSG